MEPDMIDMMSEAELKAELRKVLIENADLKKKLKSHNSEYLSPEAKSCRNCKWGCVGHENAMCTANDYCDWEPA